MPRQHAPLGDLLWQANEAHRRQIAGLERSLPSARSTWNTDAVKEKRARWVLPACLSVAMGLALCVRIALVWSELPEPFASHFGSGGRPDAFTSKAGFLAAIAIFGGGSVLLVFVSPLLLRFVPSRLISLPNRDYWLATDERRRDATDRLAGAMGWVGAATTAILVIATELTLQANLEQTNLDEATLLVFLGLYFVYVIFAVSRIFTVFQVPEPSAS